MDTIRILAIAVLSAILAFIQPIQNSIIVLSVVFSADILFGVLVDIFVHNDRIRPKKAIFALLFLFLYCSVIANVFLIGKLMGDLEEAVFIAKTLTYIFVAFYIANSLRNLTELFPQNRVWLFLYHIFGLEILKKMPVLYNFIFGHKEKEDENK